MKYKYIFIMWLLIRSAAAWGCGPFVRSFLAEEYNFFRIAGDNMEGKSVSQEKVQKEANLASWQNLTSADIPVKDIEEVVYRWTSKQLQALSKEVEQGRSKSKNRLVCWLVEHRDREVMDFLLLAKACEETRERYMTAWYYPVDGDEKHIALERLAEQALAYNGKRLRDRYTLQALRALFASDHYEEVIALWHNRYGTSPACGDVVKEMGVKYVGLSYYQQGEYEKAHLFYTQNGDYPNGYPGEYECGVPYLLWLYKHDPNLPLLKEHLQEFMHRNETDECYMDAVPRVIYGKQAEEIDLILEEKVKAKDMSPWYYAKAFFDMKLGKKQSAWQYVCKAVETAKDDDTRDAARALKMLICIQNAERYDQAMENYVYGELKWFDLQIAKNLTADDRENIRQLGAFNNLCGYSQYYWSDAMRKIVIGYLIPLCIKSGYQTRALQFANFADNCLLGHVDQIGYMQEIYDPVAGYSCTPQIGSWEQYRQEKHAHNEYDYKNDYFVNLDSIGVRHVMRLANRMEHPRSGLDRLLNKGGYSDMQFLYNIIGTQLITAMRYREAAEYLSKVSKEFQEATNVSQYSDWDPFTEKKIKGGDALYKLHFAQKMAKLEKEIKDCHEPNSKADLMLLYMRGLRSSVSYRCWKLTSFYCGSFEQYDLMSTYQADLRDAVNARADAIQKEAFALYTDREREAKAYYDLCLYKTVAERFADTKTGQLVKGHCDRLTDYTISPYQDYRLRYVPDVKEEEEEDYLAYEAC